MKYGLSLAIGLLVTSLASPVLAQTRTIRGKVADAWSREPVTTGQVHVQGTDKRTTIAQNGAFELTVASGDITLVIGSVGFVQRNVLVPASQDTITVFLSRATLTLDAIRVASGAGYAADFAATSSSWKILSADRAPAEVIALSFGEPGRRTLECDRIPTEQEISGSTGDFYRTWMSKDALINVNTAIANWARETTSDYYVANFEWSKSCQTSDPDMQIVYGWRLMVIVAGTEAQHKANLDLAQIAASATLNSTNTTVRVVTTGVTGPKYKDLVETADGLPLNVETYPQLANKLRVSTAVLDSAAIHVVNRLYETNTTVSFRLGLMRGFALTELLKGRACSQVVPPEGLQDLHRVISEVYESVGVSCTAGVRPTQQQRELAKQRLLGLRVERE